MAEVFNNIFVRGLSGAVGDQFVIRRTRSGKTIIANKPVFDKNRVFTEAQLEQQSAFKRATAYAKANKRHPLYVERAKANNSIAYNMAIADWFGVPEVLNVDATNLTGQAGQTMTIRAQDDTQVTRVRVVIRDDGNVLEQGEGVRSETDGLLWTYTTTIDHPAGPALQMDVNAYDLPGNSGAMSYPLN